MPLLARDFKLDNLEVSDAMFSFSFTCFLATALFLAVVAAVGINPKSPTVTVKNGTYWGKHVPEWQQDQFLGIPYAIPPLGPLRFARPKSLDVSFAGTRKATEYGFSCYQYSNPNFTLSEDCLTLNGLSLLNVVGITVYLCFAVVRPAGTTRKDKLPVLVWIYGGGLYAGSTADPQYNISGITHVGQEIGKPIITGRLLRK